MLNLEQLGLHLTGIRHAHRPCPPEGPWGPWVESPPVDGMMTASGEEFDDGMISETPVDWGANDRIISETPDWGANDGIIGEQANLHPTLQCRGSSTAECDVPTDDMPGPGHIRHDHRAGGGPPEGDIAAAELPDDWDEWDGPTCTVLNCPTCHPDPEWEWKWGFQRDSFERDPFGRDMLQTGVRDGGPPPDGPCFPPYGDDMMTAAGGESTPIVIKTAADDYSDITAELAMCDPLVGGCHPFGVFTADTNVDLGIDGDGILDTVSDILDAVI